MTSSDCRASKIIWHDTKLEPISWVLNIENRLFSICVGVWVGGHHATNFSHISKDAQENFVSFDTNVVVVGDGANMVLNEKLTKNWKSRGLKLRGFTWNQTNTPYSIYKVDQDKKLNIQLIIYWMIFWMKLNILDECHKRNFKNWIKFLKSDFQGIGLKF